MTVEEMARVAARALVQAATAHLASVALVRCDCGAPRCDAHFLLASAVDDPVPRWMAVEVASATGGVEICALKVTTAACEDVRQYAEQIAVEPARLALQVVWEALRDVDGALSPFDFMPGVVCQRAATPSLTVLVGLAAPGSAPPGQVILVTRAEAPDFLGRTIERGTGTLQ